ncbi:MAG: hypothetical protein ACI4MS_02035 [Candidatus Coproplasma sp.]
MSGYVKKIAVIKQVKGGFSADGGLISGLVKAETYAGFLKVETSLINFAPLNEGRYVFGITDGKVFSVFEETNFEAESQIDIFDGFAFMVCFCHNGASPVASASCGRAGCFLPTLKEEIARCEKGDLKESSKGAKPDKSSVKDNFKDKGEPYDDEAITEVNYYEGQTFEGGQPLFKGQEQKENGRSGEEDEEDSRPVQIEKDREELNGGLIENGVLIECEEQSVNNYEEEEQPVTKREDGVLAQEDLQSNKTEDTANGLADGDFYSRMRQEIENIFATYPCESELQKVIKGSRFAKIDYGDNKYYVFGVLTVEGKPKYICYGVPSYDEKNAPPSLRGCSSYIPCGEHGYWLMYQDASTGVSVEISCE